MTISRNLSFLAEGVSSTGVLGATYGGTGQSSITTGDLLYGSASNTISKLAIGSTGTILRVVAGVPSWGTDYTGTVTSVAALTLGTTGTDLSSTVANGTTTPVITLNVPTASATNRGVLSSTDWTTFNNKGSGSVTSVAASVPSFLSISGSPITTSGTLAITLSGTALPTTSGGTGLTSLTANYIPYGNGTSAFNSVSTFQSDGTRLSIGGSLQSGVTFYSNAASGDNKLRADASAGTTSSYLVFVNTTVTSVGTENSSGGNLVAGSSPYATILANSGAYPLQLGTNNTVRATIFSSGGVSIGNTTDPGAGNLSVNGGGIGIPSNLNVTTNGSTVLYADSSQILYTGGLTSAVISGAGLNVYGPSSSGGVGPIAMVNGFATTKKWTMGPNSGGTFLVYNDAGVGAYLTYGGTTWTPNVSDSRLKNKISDIYNALDAINLLNPLTFYYKNESQDGTPRYGHFAQDVGNAIPDAKIISPQKDDILGDIYTYDPNIINVYLVKALQELSAKFDAYVASHP